jgi:hypothetical protein
VLQTQVLRAGRPSRKGGGLQARLSYNARGEGQLLHWLDLCGKPTTECMMSHLLGSSSVS